MMGLERDVPINCGEQSVVLAQAHVMTRVELGAVLADDDLTNTLLVDSADDWLAKVPTSNPLIQTQLEEIRPINAALLTGVRKLRATYARGEKAAAREALEKEVTPMAMKIIVLMRPMRAEAKKVTALRKKMNHQLMTGNFSIPVGNGYERIESGS